MKDMYSFDSTQEALDVFYEKAIQAYKIYLKKIGLGPRTYLTLASEVHLVPSFPMSSDAYRIR